MDLVITVELMEEYNTISEYEKDKKVFMEIYEKVMKEEIDLHTLSAETINKISILLKEDIKIKERYVEILKSKLNNC